MIAINTPTITTSFPSSEINPKLKDKNWHKRWAEALYQRYTNDNASIAYSRRAEIDLLRLYGVGNQPVEKYMDVLSPKDQRTGSRNGYMNISWDIIPIIPKFRDLILGMFQKMEYDIYADAIDEKAQERKKFAKWRVWATKELREKLLYVPKVIEVEQKMGLPGFSPDTLDELEMMSQLGAFKLAEELAIEKLLNYSFYLSRWPEIKSKLFEDLFDVGMAVTKDYIDPITGQAKCRYVDVKNYVSNYFSDHTGRSVKAAGEIKGMNLADLRREAKDQFTEDEYKDIEAYCKGFTTNSDDTYFAGNYDKPNYDVEIMDMEFFDFDIKKYEKRQTPSGEEFVYEKDFNYSKKKTEKRTPSEIYKKTVRRCKWIVGTKFVYDWGYQNDIPREQKNEASLSYHTYKVSDKGMLSRMVPFADAVQLAYLKINNAIAMAAPSGLIVEVNSLKNVSIGGKKMSPLELLRIYRQTGDIIYSATTHHSEFQAVGGAPITQNPGGLGKDFNDMVNVIEKNIDLMRRAVGISPSLDQANINPEVPVGTSKIQVGSTNNVMHNLFVGYEHLKESTARNMTRRWQIISKYKQVEGVYTAVGKATLEILKVNKGTDFGQMGIRLEMRATAEFKAEVKQVAMASMSASKQGMPGISVSDYMYISRLLDYGNVKLAQVYLAWKEEKVVSKLQEQQQMAAEQQQQMAAQQAQQSMEAKGNELSIKEEARAGADIQIETTKSNLRDKERAHRAEMDKQINSQKSALDTEKMVTQDTFKVATELKNKTKRNSN